MPQPTGVLPLQGVKVVEFGQLIAGPFAGKTLGDFGAEVIKVEPPGEGDPLRTWRKLYQGTSVWWQVQSRNKQSMALDLRHAKGQEIARLERKNNLPVTVNTAGQYDFTVYYKANPTDQDLQSKVEAEVDAVRGELKSFYYDDKSYWNKPPPIGLPISTSPQRTTNQSPPGGTAPRSFTKKPSRPPSSFNPPVPQ